MTQLSSPIVFQAMPFANAKAVSSRHLSSVEPRFGILGRNKEEKPEDLFPSLNPKPAKKPRSITRGLGTLLLTLGGLVGVANTAAPLLPTSVPYVADVQAAHNIEAAESVLNASTQYGINHRQIVSDADQKDQSTAEFLTYLRQMMQSVDNLPGYRIDTAVQRAALENNMTPGEIDATVAVLNHAKEQGNLTDARAVFQEWYNKVGKDHIQHDPQLVASIQTQMDQALQEAHYFQLAADYDGYVVGGGLVLLAIGTLARNRKARKLNRRA